ncbi:hypothetical protein KJ840_00880 [Patescibacteria group bacterium]|nr:hypothetical protein [Patescibacteria group bacterium]
MPYLSQEEINKMYENDPQFGDNSEKEESKDNFIDRKGRGSSFRKIRKTAIILYVILTILIIAKFLFTAFYTGVVVDFTKSPGSYAYVFIFISLIAGKKVKLVGFPYWYMRWFNIILILLFLTSIILLIFYFFTILLSLYG